LIVTIPNHLGATAAGAPAPAAPVGRLRAAHRTPGDDRARTPLTPPPRPDHG
jgi:hypothetical protein